MGNICFLGSRPPGSQELKEAEPKQQPTIARLEGPTVWDLVKRQVQQLSGSEQAVHTAIGATALLIAIGALVASPVLSSVSTLDAEVYLVSNFPDMTTLEPDQQRLYSSFRWHWIAQVYIATEFIALAWIWGQHKGYFLTLQAGHSPVRTGERVISEPLINMQVAFMVGIYDASTLILIVLWSMHSALAFWKEDRQSQGRLNANPQLGVTATLPEVKTTLLQFVGVWTVIGWAWIHSLVQDSSLSWTYAFVIAKFALDVTVLIFQKVSKSLKIQTTEAWLQSTKTIVRIFLYIATLYAQKNWPTAPPP